MLTRYAIIVVDLGFGDAGKGTIVDYLARKSSAPLVVRFNGGAQAGHNVITPEGVHHTFAQFGSGMFSPAARTHLSRFMLVDPLALMTEADALTRKGVRNVFKRLTIDAHAKIVTPFHKAGNRLREFLRGSGQHGTCGMGVGETMADDVAFPHRTVYAQDLPNPVILFEKLSFFQKLKHDEFAPELSRITDESMRDEVRLLLDPEAPHLCAKGLMAAAAEMQIVAPEKFGELALASDLIFEGAQGVLLDEWYGFHPHTTWSTTTTENALTLLSELSFASRVERLGVLRTYHTRHGTGPFVTADPGLTPTLPEPHNGAGGRQGSFRRGWFDMVMAHYALAVSPVDAIALTHCDALARLKNPQVALEYTVQSMSATERNACSARDECVSALKMKKMKTDLIHQEILTAILTKATPQYNPAPRTAYGFAEMLEGSLGVPVTLVSHGVHALSKEARAPYARAA